MRTRGGFLLGILLTGCAPAKPPVVARHAPPSAAVVKVPEKPPAPVQPKLPKEPVSGPKLVTRDISGITFEGVAFDSRNFRLVVVDQAGGPGSQFADATSAGASRHGFAAVNAGFFTPEGGPLGLVLSGGKAAGSWNSASSLGSGIWYENAAGDSAIMRREIVGRSTALAMRELIQAGPLLVENGRPASGLDTTKTSARTAVLGDGNTRWWIGRTSPCTLEEFSKAIVAGDPAGWQTSSALNFDGGRSSDLWVSSAISGGPITRRPMWNKPVRNFIVLVPR